MAQNFQLTEKPEATKKEEAKDKPQDKPVSGQGLMIFAWCWVCWKCEVNGWIILLSC